MKIMLATRTFEKDASIDARNQIVSFADELVTNPHPRPLTEDELIALLHDCDGAIAGIETYSAKVMDACPKLKAISLLGVGYDNIDLEAASARGIVVTNTTGSNSEAVADHTFALILGLARHISLLDTRTKNGLWQSRAGFDVFGTTLGIIGLGNIGQAVARRAKGFSMRILAYSPRTSAEAAAACGAELVSLETLLAESDYVSLHTPRTKETMNMLDEKALRSMKKGAFLINTARGGIVNEDALVRVLEEKHLSGAALDAFAQEPPQKSPLWEMDNVILTPHVGSHAKSAIANMARRSVQNLIDVLSGKGSDFVVNR